MNRTARRTTNWNPAARRGRESGSALLIVLLLMCAVLVAGVSAATMTTSTLKGLGQLEVSDAEVGASHSAAASVIVSLRTDVPARYDADVAQARSLAAGRRDLPAFDPSATAPSASRPVARVNAETGELQPTGNQPGSCTSLLGQIDAWASARTKVAEDYAAQHGYGPDVVNVVSLKEVSRPSVAGGGESAYVLEYRIDAKGGEAFFTRPRGRLVLGPASLSGCGTLVTASAEPTTVVRGGAATITVTYESAGRVEVRDSAGALVLSQNVTEQSAPQTLTLNVSPVNSETYRVTAFGSGGCQAESAALRITVVDPPCPSIRLFTATPVATTPGGDVVLSWDVGDAAVVRLNGEVVSSAGSRTVRPMSDETYTLQAEGPGGYCPQVAQVVVSVTPCPTIEFFEAVPSSVTTGEEATLRWRVLNAGPGVSVTLNGSPVNASDTVRVRPGATTTYELRVDGPGGCPAQQQFVTVTVNQPPCPQITLFRVTPTSVLEGDAVAVEWAVSNPGSIAGVQLSGPGVNQAVAPTGTLTVSLPTQGSYTFTLSVTPSVAGCPPERRDAAVRVDPRPGGSCPVVNRFNADTSCALPGAPVTLTWDAVDADDVSIADSAGNVVGSGLPLAGTLVVNPTSTTVYTISAARGSCSTATRPVTVEVSEPAPTIISFDASPSDVRPGEPTTLAYRISGAARASINGVPVDPTAGSRVEMPSGTTDFVLEAWSGGCNPQRTVRTARVNVTACPRPSIARFDATPARVVEGGQTTLSWQVNDADAGATVRLTGPGVDRLVSPSGSLSVAPPAVAGVYTYRLAVVNSCDPSFSTEQTASVEVIACPPPQILDFTASPTSVPLGAGGFVRLSWQVADPSGTGVSVSISPDGGGGLPPSGSVDVSAPATTTTYTLTATSGCGATATASVTVQVQTAGGSGLSIDFQTIGIYSNNGNFALCTVSARLNDDGRIEVGGCMRSNAPGITTPTIAQYTAQLQVIDGATGAVLGSTAVFSQPLPGFQQDIPFPDRFFTPAAPVTAGANLEMIFTISMPDGNTWVLDTRGKVDGQFNQQPNPRAPGNYNWTVRRYAAHTFPTRCGGF